jgi:hypothetical protein
VNQKEAARRQKVIATTLQGLREILTTNLHQEMDPSQEAELFELIYLGQGWIEK